MSLSGDLLTEPVRWDGKRETLELLRERMPECLSSYDPSAGVLHVRTLKKVSAKGFVHDTGIVPTGWYVIPRTCRVHGQRYAAIKPPVSP